MLLPLLVFFCNNTAFRHQHVLADGTVIEHAHYHHQGSRDSQDSTNHEHTEKELLLYALISDSPVKLDIVILLPDLHQHEKENYKIVQVQNISFNNPLLSYLLRAPPSTFST